MSGDKDKFILYSHVFILHMLFQTSAVGHLAMLIYPAIPFKNNLFHAFSKLNKKQNSSI